jgi:signal peptidase I
MRTVRDIASDMGVSYEEVLRRLRALGRPAPGVTATVDPEAAARIEAMGPRTAAGDGRARRPPPPPPPPRSTAPARNGGPTGEAPAAARRAPPRPAPPPPPPRSAPPAGAVVDPWAHEATPLPQAPPAEEALVPPRQRRGWSAQLAELPVLVLLAFGIAVLIKTFLVQAFFIPSGSMLPTLRVGDRVLVEKVSYRLRDPRPGDVVVFAKSVFGSDPDLPWYDDARNFMRELLGLPTGAEQDYIKRIVAVGGDTIRYAGKPRALEVNGEVIEESYTKPRQDRFSPMVTGEDCDRLKMGRADGGCIVPEGEVFVMGDNRGNSEDSRAIGPVAETKIVGHAFVIIWPPSDISGI